jgi:hypothetical protein
MAESLNPSPQSEKRSTRKTARLTPEMALEILTAAFRECERADIQLEVMGADMGGVIVRIGGVVYQDGMLVPVKK